MQQEAFRNHRKRVQSNVGTDFTLLHAKFLSLVALLAAEVSRASTVESFGAKRV